MHPTRWTWLAALAALAACASPALAGWGGWFGGLPNQSRVIQICIVVIGLALFIMLKKSHHR